MENKSVKCEEILRKMEVDLILNLSGPSECDIRELLAKTDSLNIPTCKRIENTLICVSRALRNCNLKEVFDGEEVQSIFQVSGEPDSFKQNLRIKIRDLVGDSDNEIQELAILLLAVSSCLLFIEANWINESSVDDLKTSTNRNEVLVALCVDESVPYHLVKNPELLLIGEILLEELVNIQTASWWLLRVYSIHAAVLDERSPSLYRKILNLADDVAERPYIKDRDDWRMHATFHLELAQSLMRNFKTSKAWQRLRQAERHTGLSVHLSGALGKRTRFQQDAVSQLIIVPEEDADGKKSRLNDLKCPCDSEKLPKDVALNDETLLNRIQFVEIDDTFLPLYPIEQAAVLVHCMLIKQSNPVHELVNEQMRPYVQYVLNQPCDWCVQSKALAVRSAIEDKRTRTIERSMTQLEQLVNAFRRTDFAEFSSGSLRTFFCIMPSPFWELEMQLAKLLISLGVVKGALDVFTRLEMWEDMIGCYHLLQRKDKAEAVVRKLLEKEETVKLYCLLGDATENPEHYLKAWELSGQKSARAQRSLGNIYYCKGKFREALPYFTKSVEMNSLQPQIWFSLAYCAHKLEDHEIAAKAYRKCVGIEPENFEAWNNLSNAYIRLKQKPRALNALQEALKLNYENWHIWENYLLVACDCGDFDEVVKSCHRLLDLKEKHVDVEVLGILVKAIKENIPDFKGQDSRLLKPLVLKLFGRITSVVTSNAEIWEQYAILCSCEEVKSVETLEKIVSLRQKAHRCMIQKADWEKNKDARVKVMKNAEMLYDCCVSLNDARNGGSFQVLSSCKLMLKGIICSVEKMIGNCIGDADEEIKQHLERLQCKFDIIVEKLKTL